MYMYGLYTCHAFGSLLIFGLSKIIIDANASSNNYTAKEISILARECNNY